MNDPFAQRVRAAAVAGWWALLIAVAFTAIQWLAFLNVMRVRPAWLLALWGPDTTWATVQSVWFWTTAIFKLCLWVLVTVVIWLTLWARRLGKLDRP